MKYYLILFSLSIAGIHCEEQPLLEKFKAGNNGFSVDVYNEVKATEKGNFLFCPLSAEIILALTRIGAKGNTGKQLSKTLHLSDDIKEIESIFKEMTPKLKGNDNYTLNSANKIYLAPNYQIQENFKNVAQKFFSADITNINFANTEAAAGEINSWVAEQTNDKIQNLIDPKLLSKQTATVLVNALYFKGTWATKFDKANTKSKPFYLNNKDTVNVDMMEITDNFQYFYSEEFNAQILEMPYVGQDYSLVVVLPYDKEGLEDLENKLNEVLQVISRYNVKVHVQMPKFKIGTEVKLTDILKNLGVKDAFENYADFSGFTAPGERPMKISEVVQKAIIEVEEAGTTAAAATAASSVFTYWVMRPIIEEFNADHPFIYYIKGPNGVMFIGRYVQK